MLPHSLFLFSTFVVKRTATVVHTQEKALFYCLVLDLLPISSLRMTFGGCRTFYMFPWLLLLQKELVAEPWWNLPFSFSFFFFFYLNILFHEFNNTGSGRENYLQKGKGKKEDLRITQMYHMSLCIPQTRSKFAWATKMRQEMNILAETCN